jgi:hypothetical protein
MEKVLSTEQRMLRKREGEARDTGCKMQDT